MSVLDNFTVAEVMAMSPEERTQLAYAVMEEDRRDMAGAQEKALTDQKEAEKRQMLQDLTGAVVAPAAMIGGMYAAQSFLAPAATAAATTAGTTAAGAAGTAAATGGAAAGAGTAAGTAAGTTAAGTAAGTTAGTTTAGTLGSSTLASAALPAAAIAYGLYRGSRMYGHLKNSDGGMKGATQGFKEGLKPANMLGMGLIGAPFVGAAMGAFGHKPTKMIQKDRWIDAGREDLIDNAERDYFAGTKGETSRDEKYLTADAIRINPDNYNNIEDWDSWERDKQDLFLNGMLEAGKVREKKGGIYYDDDYAKQLANQIRGGNVNPGMQIAKGLMGGKHMPQAMPQGQAMGPQMQVGAKPNMSEMLQNPQAFGAQRPVGQGFEPNGQISDLMYRIPGKSSGGTGIQQQKQVTPPPSAFQQATRPAAGGFMAPPVGGKPAQGQHMPQQMQPGQLPQGGQDLMYRYPQQGQGSPDEARMEEILSKYRGGAGPFGPRLKMMANPADRLAYELLAQRSQGQQG